MASVNVDETDENTYLLTEEGDTRTLFMKREENGESENGEEEHDH